MSITANQFARLPMYARNEIHHLRAENARMHKQLSEGPEDARVFVWQGLNQSIPIGHDPVVEFYTQGSPDAESPLRWTYRFSVKIVSDSLIEVMGGESLAIYPRSGNVVQIGPAPR